MKTTEEDL